MSHASTALASANSTSQETPAEPDTLSEQGIADGKRVDDTERAESAEKAEEGQPERPSTSGAFGEMASSEEANPQSYHAKISSFCAASKQLQDSLEGVASGYPRLCLRMRFFT